MDKITVKGLKLFAYHGVNPEEKQNGQPFVIDVDYYLDLEKACHSDCLDDTVSYAKVVKTIRSVFTAESFDLIERAAQAVAEALLAAYPSVMKTEITVKKPEAPVSADFDYMAVTVVRERTV
ncbi:MAG: dihydroneopterin aldolase [Eubacterium sp.]|nr:dihydroneopterin aldolase [Eubacterium sp.]